jgi:hypothetical protein
MRDRKLYPNTIQAFAFAIILSLLPGIAWSMAGKDHAGDMIEVFIGDRSARVPDLRNMCLKVTATIDNFKVIKGLPVGDAGHRVYGHWGFSGSITETSSGRSTIDCTMKVIRFFIAHPLSHEISIQIQIIHHVVFSYSEILQPIEHEKRQDDLERADRLTC